MTIEQQLEKIIPHGERCKGCTKGEPHIMEGYLGDVFCHLLEDIAIDGYKICEINMEECEL